MFSILARYPIGEGKPKNLDCVRKRKQKLPHREKMILIDVVITFIHITCVNSMKLFAFVRFIIFENGNSILAFN